VKSQRAVTAAFSHGLSHFEPMRSTISHRHSLILDGCDAGELPWISDIVQWFHGLVAL